MKDGQGVRTRSKMLKMREMRNTARMQNICDGLTDTQNDVEDIEYVADEEEGDDGEDGEDA